MKTTKLALLTLALLAILGGVLRAKAAQFTFDLRIDSVGGGAIITDGANKIVNSGVGGTVTVSLWAVITGSNATQDEGFLAGTGSIKSGSGPYLGNISSPTVNEEASFFFSTPGTPTDLDGDTDIDLGATSTISAADYPAWGYFPTNTTGTSSAADLYQLKLETITFTVTSAPFASTTALQFFPRIKTVNDSVFKWTSDGVSHIEKSTISSTNLAPNPNIGVGTPITIGSLPEPSTGVLAAIGCGLLFWWRKRFR